jgi:hypothetical protein
MRRLIGDAMALGLVTSWLLLTGAFLTAVHIANRIEGRR